MSPATGLDKTQRLKRLASRLRSNGAFMASILAAYQQQERMDDAQLAQRLGMQEERLPLLALCGRPDSSGAEFTRQLRQISDYAGADHAALAQVIRQVEAVSRLRSAPQEGSRTADAKPFTAASPFLSAARDHPHQVSDMHDDYKADSSDEDEDDD